jgi:diguanylate cyclase (GGDEF)-like protein
MDRRDNFQEMKMLQRLLIIDDSLPLQKLIKSHLESEDLEIHSAYDGEAGIALAADIRPGAILLDVDMPDMDGFEVCRRLKLNVDTNSIPIIFLTADFATGDKVKGLELGAVDYVTKPYKPEELSARVRASLRMKSMLDQKAMIDGLTGLWNRKYLDDHLAAQTSLALRTGRPMSCIAVDVDGLRQINKKHGIPFGDEILRSVGNILLGQCRTEDAVCRCDGGQFAIAVSAMSRTGAARLADRLCATIHRELFSHGGKEIGVTCSFGVVDSLIAGQDMLLKRALDAVLRAKKNGGNCVSVARPPRVESRAA